MHGRKNVKELCNFFVGTVCIYLKVNYRYVYVVTAGQRTTECALPRDIK